MFYILCQLVSKLEFCSSLFYHSTLWMETFFHALAVTPAPHSVGVEEGVDGGTLARAGGAHHHEVGLSGAQAVDLLEEPSLLLWVSQ